MIQQAAQEVGFEAEDIPLMVEAIPLSSESIMLIVTKVEDPEELDTRFSKFSPFAEAESENLLSQLADEFLEGAGDLAKLLGQNGTEELKANVNTAAENTGTDDPYVRSPFMAETVKVLSPDKKVLLSSGEAGCPMAEQLYCGRIERIKKTVSGLYSSSLY